MENSILKIKEKPLYTLEVERTSEDCILIMKYFPKFFWNRYMVASILILVGAIIAGAYYHSFLVLLILFVILEIICLIYFYNNNDKLVTKEFNEENKGEKIVEYYEFYSEYLLASNDSRASRLLYSKITKFIESDSNFYLEYDKSGTIIDLKKEKMSLELQKFIRNKFADLPLKKEKIEPKKNHQKILNILFGTTIFSLFAALYLIGYLMRQYPSNGFYNENHFWIAWCFLPIPLISVILGFKWEKQCNNKKNLVYGFLTIFLLGFMGAFSLLFNDEDIYRYNDIIGFTVPNSKLVGSNYSAFDGDKSEFKHITINYMEENTDNLVEEIKNDSNWITDKEVVESLSLIIPLDSFIGDNTTYYLIYNETTKEYNKLPDDNGKYTISAIKYSDSSKILEFNSYTINYEK